MFKLLLDCSSHALVSDFGDLKASTNKPMYYLHSSSTVIVCDMMVLPGEINLILCSCAGLASGLTKGLR